MIMLNQSDENETGVVSAAQIRAADPRFFRSIQQLHATRFGPGRFSRSAYRIREGAPWPSDYCKIATHNDQLLGSVTATPIQFESTGVCGILVGPVVVAEPHTGQTLGQQLIDATVQSAVTAGEQFALLVGDLAYYQRVGFEIANAPVLKSCALLPGPADPARVLIRPLNNADLSTSEGLVRLRHT